jgi:hypothetical protein
VARRFFDNSARSSDAISWLELALKGGVDPNLRIPSDSYGSEGLLVEALRAGNVNGVKLLLRAGASPHPYQDLYLTRYFTPRFIFPLSYLADNDRFSSEEKKDLARSFLAAGAVVPDVIAPARGFGWESVMHEVKNLHDEVLPTLGLKPVPTSTIAGPSSGPICEAASVRYKEDWCALINAMPKKLKFLGGAATTPVYDIELRYLLHVERTKAHFLAVARPHFSQDYVIVEVPKDSSSWTVLLYTDSQPGMGACKKDADGYQPDVCWRRVPLRQVPGTDQMRFSAWNLTWQFIK